LKPEHNQYDNIWEIRQKTYSNEDQVQQIIRELRKSQGYDISTPDVTQIGDALVFSDVKKFVGCTLGKHFIRLPVWKIVIPRLEGDAGSIYYVAETKDYNYIFRGTYGYGGTGPHESALVEACFEKCGLSFEVRDGDYLINFLYPRRRFR